METETTTSEFPNGGKAIVQQILESKEKNENHRTMRITVWNPSRSFEIGKL